MTGVDDDNVDVDVDDDVDDVDVDVDDGDEDVDSLQVVVDDDNHDVRWQRDATHVAKSCSREARNQKQSLTPIILFLGNFLDQIGNFLDLPLQRHNNDIVQDDNNNA